MDQAEDTILQVCQLTELKQTSEWESYPNRFRRFYETRLPENFRKHFREWSENRKPQDRIVYTDGSVTKDQLGWGFLVKQGATTIYEDSATYTVSASSLTMEVEAVTHALRKR